MKRVIKASYGYYKTRYEVHWISPDGNDKLLGGSKTEEGANEIAQEQAKEIFESPWESDKRKFHFLENLYIVDTETEQDVETIDTADYIDSLMSELDSRMHKGK